MRQSTDLDSGDSSLRAGTTEPADTRANVGFWAWGEPSRAAAPPHASESAAQCAAQCEPLPALPTACRHDDGPAGCGESGPWCCGAAGQRHCPCPPRCPPGDPSNLAHTRPLSWFTQPLELLVGWDHARLERSISSSRLAAGNTQQELLLPFSSRGPKRQQHDQRCPLQGLRHHVRGLGRYWPLFCCIAEGTATSVTHLAAGRLSFALSLPKLTSLGLNMCNFGMCNWFLSLNPVSLFRYIALERGWTLQERWVS